MDHNTLGRKNVEIVFTYLFQIHSILNVVIVYQVSNHGRSTDEDEPNHPLEHPSIVHPDGFRVISLLCRALSWRRQRQSRLRRSGPAMVAMPALFSSSFRVPVLRVASLVCTNTRCVASAAFHLVFYSSYLVVSVSPNKLLCVCPMACTFDYWNLFVAWRPSLVNFHNGNERSGVVCVSAIWIYHTLCSWARICILQCRGILSVAEKKPESS